MSSTEALFRLLAQYSQSGGTPGGYISKLRCARTLALIGETRDVRVSDSLIDLDPKYRPFAELNPVKWLTYPNFKDYEGRKVANLPITQSLNAPTFLDQLQMKGLFLWIYVPDVIEIESQVLHWTSRSNFHGILVFDKSRTSLIAHLKDKMDMWTTDEMDVVYFTTLVADWEIKSFVELSSLYVIDASKIPRKKMNSRRKGTKSAADKNVVLYNLHSGMLSMISMEQFKASAPVETATSTTYVAAAGPADEIAVSSMGLQVSTSQSVNVEIRSTLMTTFDAEVVDTFDLYDPTKDQIRTTNDYSGLNSISNWRELLSPSYLMEYKPEGRPFTVSSLAHYAMASKAVLMKRGDLAKEIIADKNRQVDSLYTNYFDYKGVRYELNNDATTTWNDQRISIINHYLVNIFGNSDAFRMAISQTGEARIRLDGMMYVGLMTIRDQASRNEDDEYSSEEYSDYSEEYADSDEEKDVDSDIEGHEVMDDEDEED